MEVVEELVNLVEGVAIVIILNVLAPDREEGKAEDVVQEPGGVIDDD